MIPSDTITHVPPFTTQWALFLDVDGTLLEFAATPTAVYIPNQLPKLLNQLCQNLHGALALISGRTVKDLKRLFPTNHIPMSGSHGIEISIPGETIKPASKLPKLSPPIKQQIQKFVAYHPLLLLEEKKYSIAIHFRQAPQLESLVNNFMIKLLQTLTDDWQLNYGHKVIELIPHVANKGQAIEKLMTNNSFQQRIPVFIGDDLTDENGFTMVQKLNGHAIKVGPGTSCAKWFLPNPTGVLQWLELYQCFLANQHSTENK